MYSQTHSSRVVSERLGTGPSSTARPARASRSWIGAGAKTRCCSLSVSSQTGSIPSWSCRVWTCRIRASKVGPCLAPHSADELAPVLRPADRIAAWAFPANARTQAGSRFENHSRTGASPTVHRSGHSPVTPAVRRTVSSTAQLWVWWAVPRTARLRSCGPAHGCLGPSFPVERRALTTAG